MWTFTYWNSTYWAPNYWVKGIGDPAPGLTFYDGPLTHSPADIVRHLIAILGGGSVPSDMDEWPIYTTMEPDLPDDLMTTYDTSGITYGRLQVNGVVPEHYGVQLRLRCNDPTFGWRKINEVKLILDQVVNNTLMSVGSSFYLVQVLCRKGGVLSLGRETPQTKRLLWTINYTCSIKEVVR